MPLIELETRVSAPVERVFDLAHSVDAHKISAAFTRERAVDGRTTGLMGMGETVTWKARHFWIRLCLRVVITEFDRPRAFADEMVSGPFESMRHSHRFTTDGSTTLMSDSFEFVAPLGILGRIAESLFLTRYMARFLESRNRNLKQMAESDEWQHFLVPRTE